MSKTCVLGIDIGTSSIKVVLADVDTGERLASATSPEVELPIESPQSGWAEQDPDLWWSHVIAAVNQLPAELRAGIQGIGIAYQMHGLVLVDEALKPSRNAIIWCDSRAVQIGEKAYSELGKEFCLSHLLNSPGNFTASKIRWVIENEPEVFQRSRWAMLPGDYIATKLTRQPATTASGLSEMALWDFSTDSPSDKLLNYFGIPPAILPPVVPTFGSQGNVNKESAEALGIPAGTPVTYRAGDQPNNALALGALEPGEIGATAGTSGVVYSVTDQQFADPEQRVNTFLHVNHTNDKPRYGVLCCVNGCGSLISWLRYKLFDNRFSYDEMNQLASTVPAGSNGLIMHPFGNGAERVLNNQNPGASLSNLDFSRHTAAHFCRAAQEGVAFSLRYGIESTAKPSVIRAAKANLFLSPVFAQTMADLTGAQVEIRDTDGALGAALGAARGCGFTDFKHSPVVKTYKPNTANRERLEQSYDNWVAGLAVP